MNRRSMIASLVGLVVSPLAFLKGKSLKKGELREWKEKPCSCCEDEFNRADEKELDPRQWSSDDSLLYLIDRDSQFKVYLKDCHL